MSASGQTVSFKDKDDIAIDTAAGVTGVTASEFNLTAAGAVTQAQAISATGLSVVTTGTGPVTLTTATNAVTTVAIDVASGNIAYTDADGFTVGTVNSITGIDTAGGSVALIATTGDLVVSDTGAANDIGATTTISLEASADNAVITIASGADVESTGGAHTYTADDILVTGTITATAQDVTLKSKTASDLINLGTAASGTAGTLQLTSAELSAVTAGKITVGSGSAGAITVSGDITPGGTTALSLVTGGAITGTAGGIIETDLALTAGGTINFTDANTDVDNLAVSAAGQTVTFTDADDVDIDTVAGVTGVTATTFNLNTSGAVTDNAASTVSGVTTIAAGTGNNITLDVATNNFGTVAITSGNNVTLVDANALILGASTVTGNYSVTAGGAITDSGDLAITGTTTISNAGQDVTLDRVGHDFTGAVSVTGKDVTLVDANAIELGASTVTGAYDVTAAGITLSADISAGTTLTLDAGTSNITGTGQFTSGGRTDIFASLIGDSSSYDLSPMANVTGSNLYMTLTGGKGGVSGRLRAGAKMSSAPPKTNFVSEGYIYIKGFSMYSPREGVDIEAILAAIATLSSQQEKMEAMLFSAAAGAAEFFMTEPVWLDFVLEMIYENFETLSPMQWDEMMRLLEEKRKELRSLNFAPNSLQMHTQVMQAVNSYEYNANFEGLSVMQWDEIMRFGEE